MLQLNSFCWTDEFVLFVAFDFFSPMSKSTRLDDFRKAETKANMTCRFHRYGKLYHTCCLFCGDTWRLAAYAWQMAK